MTPAPKICQTCGVTFSKPKKLSYVQWDKREFCSNVCRGVSIRRAELVDPKDGRIKVWADGQRRWRSHVVMEAALGRPLEPGEVVDHFNGDCTDDRLDNLRLFASHSEHMKTHWREGTIRNVGGFPAKWRPSSDWPA